MRPLVLVAALLMTGPALASWETRVIDRAAGRSVSLIGKAEGGDRGLLISCTGLDVGVPPSVTAILPSSGDFRAKPGAAAALRAALPDGRTWTWNGLVEKNDSRGMTLRFEVPSELFDAVTAAMRSEPLSIEASAGEIESSFVIRFDGLDVAGSQFLDACDQSRAQ